MRKNSIFIMLIILLPIGFAAISTAPTEYITSEVNYSPAEFTLETFERYMNVTAYVTPDFANETLTRFLYSAKESIYVQIYQFNSPALLSIINDIKNSKPSIDIKLMMSEHVVSGSSYNDYTAWNLTQIGIPVRWTSDTFDFSHQKFIIIDNVTTIVQSGNWAKASVPLNEWEEGSSQGLYWKNYEANREFNIAMTDTEVTGFYREVFDHDWDIGTDYNEGIDGTGTVLEWGTLLQSYYPRVFNYSTEFEGDMKVTPFVSPDTSLEGILYCINSAKYTLDIQIPYINNGTTAITEIVDALIAASERGVNVRIISNKESENEELAHELVHHGIQMVWMDTRFFAAVHNKAIIVDGSMILISSINWSETSVTANREAGVIIEHVGVAQWYQTVFDYDWGIASNEVSNGVNIGWEPTVPSSDDTINVTVYAHMLNDSEILDQVILGVKIGDGVWENHSIIDNIFLSSEVAYENYFYEIDPQPDGTNITVKAYIESVGLWNTTLETRIHVTDIEDEGPFVPEITISHPSDITYEYEDEGNSITWTATATNETDSFVITVNGTEFALGAWNGSAITVHVDGLDLGTYVYTLTLNDTLGTTASDTVNVFVEDTTNPEINSPTDITYERGATGNSITWVVDDALPHSYLIQQDGVEVDAGSWNGSSITWSVDGLEAGSYQITLIVVDTSGNSNSDSVLVAVNPTQQDQLLLYATIGIGAIVVIIIGLLTKKRR